MNKINFKKFGKTLKQSPVEIALIGVMVFGIMVSAFPARTNVDAAEDVSYVKENINLEIKQMQNQNVPFGSLPEANRRAARPFMKVAVTAYNSVPGQTDATPCIGAQGTDICQLLAEGSNTCAANFVALGTVLEVDGLGTCVVRDRMNARYHYRVDWYMGMDIASAKRFGVQTKQIGIYAS